MHKWWGQHLLQTECWGMLWEHISSMHMFFHTYVSSLCVEMTFSWKTSLVWHLKIKCHNSKNTAFRYYSTFLCDQMCLNGGRTVYLTNYRVQTSNKICYSTSAVSQSCWQFAWASLTRCSKVLARVVHMEYILFGSLHKLQNKQTGINYTVCLASQQACTCTQIAFKFKCALLFAKRL